MKKIIWIMPVLSLGLLVFGAAMWWPFADITKAERGRDNVSHDHEAELAAAGSKDSHRHTDVDESVSHNGDSGEEEPDGEEVVRLSDSELEEFGIELTVASPDVLEQYVDLPGEIVLNGDRVAHVVPIVPGIVRQVLKTTGDAVAAGELLAVMESRELAEAKASFLAAAERKKLAMANFEREERLWKQKVTSEQEYLDARQALAEARIGKNAAEQQLHALGFSETYLKELPNHPDASYTRYEVRAPFAGTVIEKHLTLGESVNGDAEVFTIADLSTVWVDINVYQKDLAVVRRGQTVTIEIGHGIPPATGKIGWLGPLVDESTRTAKARVVLANTDGALRPGLFVTARVVVGNFPAGIVIPQSALQIFEDRPVVFVRTESAYEPRPVTIGRRNTRRVEILSGLENGQTYVSKGAFTLKAQLSKAAFGDGHAH